MTRTVSSVLIAAQPHAAQVLQAMLHDMGNLIPAHTTADAFRILEQQQIDLIVSTIAFDESRMLEFLVSVKGTASVTHIPFLVREWSPVRFGTVWWARWAVHARRVARSIS